MALVLTLNGVDVTAYLGQPSLTVKFNSMDFTLVDPSAATLALLKNLTFGLATPNLDTLVYPVTLNVGGWDGQLASIRTRDIVDIASGHVAFDCTATNTKTWGAGTDGTPLSDVPASVLDDYLLEDGSGHYLLESGTFTDPGALQMEGGSIGYRNLSLQVQGNLGGTLTWFGSVTVYNPGMWPGQGFKLTSANCGSVGAHFYVSEVAITWPVPNQPEYLVSFGESVGDVPLTFAQYINSHPL